MQTSIPQSFQSALDSQCCREDQQGFALDLIEAEVLPRIAPDQRAIFIHIGANKCHLTSRVADHFQVTHVVEPNTYQLPEPDDMEHLAVHSEGIMSVHLPDGEQFVLVLCDRLLHCLAISSARNNPEAYIHRIVDDLLLDGGLAVIGTLAPRGKLHDFVSAVNPHYVGSTDVLRILEDIPGISYWVVEHSNFTSFTSPSQLEQLLQLYAYLVQPGTGDEMAGATGEGMFGTGDGLKQGSAPPAAGPSDLQENLAERQKQQLAATEVAATLAEVATAHQAPAQSILPREHALGGMTGSDHSVGELIQRFVLDAYDGVGRWNWVEEDDFILVQKHLQQAAGAGRAFALR